MSAWENKKAQPADSKPRAPPKSSPPRGDQQLFHAAMLPLWLASVLSSQDICVAILCGAPCSGKSEATRQMVERFGELLCVVSDDLFCDAENRNGLQVCSCTFPNSQRQFCQFPYLIC